MIIPKRDAKSYGAVHIDYFLTFVGFCKKVSSDEIQSIDVFIDGNKIDTIVCDKTIDKVSQIYDIEGHGFEYDLPEVYFDKRHLLSFRCSDSGEELVNSPISTICKNDEKFNEYKFANFLSRKSATSKTFFNISSAKPLIAVIVNVELLSDNSFLQYLNDILGISSKMDIGVCFYYFNHTEKSLLEKKFPNYRSKIISTPEDIAQETYVVVTSVNFYAWKGVVKFFNTKANVIPLIFDNAHHKLKVKDIKTLDIGELTNYGFSEDEIMASDYNLYKLLFLKTTYKFNDDENYYNLMIAAVNEMFSDDSFKLRLRKIIGFECKDF